MHIVGIGLLAVGVAGLVVLAAHIFWRQLVRLGHERDLDEWAQDVQTWQ